LYLARREQPSDAPVAIATIVEALEALGAEIARRNAAAAANDRAWLAEQIMRVTTSLPPRKRAKKRASRKR